MIAFANEQATTKPTQRRLRAGIRYLAHPSFRDPVEVAKIFETALPVIEGPSSDVAKAKNTSAYLARLYDAPLLDREQEAIAFLRYNYVKFCAATSEEPRRQRYLQEALAARELIVQANLRLVVSIAKTFVRGGQDDLFELISEGNLSLLRALESFDISQRVKFSTYATTAIRRHLVHYRHSEQRRCSRYIPGLDGDLETSDKRRAAKDNYDPTTYSLEQAVLPLVQRLEPRERRLVMARFGLGPHQKARSFNDLGADLGISKERARQLVQRALARIKSWAEGSSAGTAASSA